MILLSETSLKMEEEEEEEESATLTIGSIHCAHARRCHAAHTPDLISGLSAVCCF